YKGENITLLGNTFHKNSNVMVAILDSENRTSNISGKIWLLNADDKIFMDYIPTDDSRNLNKTILLPDLAKHPPGIYTTYVYFTDSLGDNGEWIPIDTFTVVEREICDGIDNDLDGVIDNGFDLDNDGFTSCGGDCNDNNENINPDATDFICNGIDNNCNNEIDESYIPTPTTCGVGECLNEGQFICIDGNIQNTCEPLTPQIEICDNLDNNCNNLIDENLYQNANAFGICKSNTQTCENGIWIDNYETTPTPEICDNLDNDCDGFTDENLIELYGTSNIGICSLGTKTCIAGIWNITILAIAPVNEICDGLDNDCDGFTDENNICGLPDEDNDGVPDEVDLCENTTPWFAEKKNKNHYDSANMYLTATYGCNCKQILDCKTGNTQGEYKTGCSQGTLDIWIDQKAWAKECKPEKEIQKKEQKTEKTKSGNTHNNLEENKINNSFNKSDDLNETENKTHEVKNKTENNSVTNTTEFMPTNNETYIKNETKTSDENSNNQNDIITQDIEKETKDYADNNDNEYTKTKTNDNTNNEIFDTEQENTIKTAKSKNQFWDIPAILKQSISNIFRALGLDSLF
ncbi:hypothetical protein GQ473_06725, partial [archaeon]|nr:hypothetical protein [archaeon]